MNEHLLDTLARYGKRLTAAVIAFVFSAAVGWFVLILFAASKLAGVLLIAFAVGTLAVGLVLLAYHVGCTFCGKLFGWWF